MVARYDHEFVKGEHIVFPTTFLVGYAEGTPTAAAAAIMDGGPARFQLQIDAAEATDVREIAASMDAMPAPQVRLCPPLLQCDCLCQYSTPMPPPDQRHFHWVMSFVIAMQPLL